MLAAAIAAGWALLDKASTGVDLELQHEAAKSEAAWHMLFLGLQASWPLIG